MNGDPQRPARRPAAPPIAKFPNAPPSKPSSARHAAWLLPLTACIGFAILIGGGLAIRRVVVLWRNAAAAELIADANADPLADSSGDNNSSGDDNSPALAVHSEQLSSEDLPPSSEPGLTVLPPLAARTPGRTLAKLLVVGAGQGMFSSLEDALAVAIRGDIVELRGEGPFWLGKTDLDFKADPAASPLVIRAGRDFRPVVRTRYPSKGDRMIEVRNAHLTLEGLHIANATVAPGYYSLVRMTGGDFVARGCSISRNAHFGSGRVALVTLAGPGTSAAIQGCLFRSTSAASMIAPDTKLSCEQCAWICDTGGVVFMSGHNRQDLDVLGCTFFASHFATHEWQAGADHLDSEPPRIAFHRNVFISPWCCLYFMRFGVLKERQKDLEREEGLLLAQRALRNLTASDNLVQFWEGGKHALAFPSLASPRWPQPHLPMFAPLGPPVSEISFGSRIGAITAAVFRGDFVAKPAELPLSARSLDPSDLTIQSKHPATAALLATGHYGADPRLLPVPPPLASEPYEPPVALAK